MDLIINDHLTIPDSELSFQTSTSGGPGGQHVNKTETKVTVQLDLDASTSLSNHQKDRIREELRTRVTKAGILQVTSQKYRSQSANRDAAISRMIQLVAEALEEEEKRKKTRVPRRTKQRRLENKRQNAEKKKLRSKPDPANF